MNIVAKFQERLEITKRNAICRVIAFIFCCILFLGVLTCSIVFFGYNATLEQKTPLLPGNHIEVESILTADVFVDKAKFLEVADGNETFVLFSTRGWYGYVFYMTTNQSGLKYVYKQTISVPDGYWIMDEKIQDGYLVNEIAWDPNKKALVHAVLPTIAMGSILLLAIFSIFWKTRELKEPKMIM